MDRLKNALQKYIECDDSLKKINQGLQEVRDARSQVEGEIAEIISRPEFKGINKFDIPSDMSKIRIQRPGEYLKSFHLSQKDLQENLKLYFKGDVAKAQECHAFIVAEQNKKLTTTEFKFTRTVKE